MIASLLVVATARANDASFYGDGTTVFAMHEPRVRMERERVVVRHVGGGTSRAWRVECEFVFRNLSHEPVTVLMGHPDWYVGEGEPAHDEGGRRIPDSWGLADFRAWVDGREVPTTHQAVEAAPKAWPRLALPEKSFLGSDEWWPGYAGAYTWTVTFAPRARVEVENSYDMGGLGSNGPLEACTYELVPPFDLTATWWERAGLEGKPWRFTDGTCSRTSYIVTTARTWNGTVGEADIRIEMPPDALPHCLLPIPRPTAVERGFLVWRFADWTPTSEINVITVRPGWTEDHPEAEEEAQRGYVALPPTVEAARTWLEECAANHFDRRTIALVRDAYFARRGHAWRNAEKRATFERFPWYEPRGRVRMRDLPEVERAIVRELSRRGAGLGR